MLAFAPTAHAAAIHEKLTPSMAATSAPSSDGLRRFTRQWLLILTLGVLGVAAALGFAALQHKRYTATASMSVNDTSQDVSLLGSVPTVNPYPTALATVAGNRGGLVRSASADRRSPAYPRGESRYPWRYLP